MTLPDWLKAQFAAVFAWFKRDTAELDQIHNDLVLIAQEFVSLTNEVRNMAGDVQDVQKGVDELIADAGIMQAATTALQTIEANETALQAAIDALKAANVDDQAAHAKLADAVTASQAARAGLQTALTPTTTATTSSTTTETPAATSTTG